MKAIECKQVFKAFGENKVLRDVTFSIESGKIYALLGRNGAGKTTLMNCLCTLFIQDSGEIRLLEEVNYENEKVLSEICFMSDFIEEFEIKKVKQILKYASCFYERWDTALMEKLLNFFEIDRKQLYSALSKGKKTLVSIIIGLCSGCKIVLFDEIYSGLDAVARQQFYKILLEEQEKNPRTFIVSTHLIEEMTEVFDGVVIMDEGRILLNEEMEEIYEKSIKCVGRTEKVECFKGKNLLYQKNMGTISEFDFYDTFTEAEQRELTEEGFSFQSLSLQELFIACTAKEEKEWRN